MHTYYTKSMTEVRRPTTVVTPSVTLRPVRGRGGVGGIIVAIVATMLLTSCAAGPTYYLHPTYDFSLLQKMAVLPLENHSTDIQAGEKVRKMVVSEVLAAGVVDVIDPGQVNRALGQERIQNISAISAEEFQKVGSNLGVQALIVGSVDNFERINVGGSVFAEVAITLRAIDAATGTVIWSATHKEGGVGTMGRLFGVGGDTTTEATQKVVRRAVATLFQ